jgi:GTPase SAR1 family protein
MFVGHSAAGKTSLKNCFQDRPTFNTFFSQDYFSSPRLSHFSTHGIDFCEIEEFLIWDFAGQKEYHSAHSLFFISSAIYLIVFDAGKENEKIINDFEDWM